MRRLLLAAFLSCTASTVVAQSWQPVVPPPTSVEEIKEIQRALIWTGFFIGQPTGKEGQMFRSAIERFQRSIGVAITGELDDAQQKRLTAQAEQIRRSFGFEYTTDRSFNVEFGYPREFLPRKEQTSRGVAYVAADGGRFEIFRVGNSHPIRRENTRIDFENTSNGQFYLRGSEAENIFHTRIVESAGKLVGYKFSYPRRLESRYFTIANVIDSTFTPLDSSKELDANVAAYFNAMTRSGHTGSKLDPVAFFEQASSSVYTLIPLIYAINNENDASQSSAVAISHNYLASNCHIGGEFKYVQFGVFQEDKQLGVAAMVAADEVNDICILERRDGPDLVPVRALRSFDSLKVGEPVYTIGSPSGLDRSLGDGLISGIRTIRRQHLVQTTAPIDQGSSGGGLFDAAGNLIGLTTFYIKSSRFLNFAIVLDEPTVKE